MLSKPCVPPAAVFVSHPMTLWGNRPLHQPICQESSMSRLSILVYMAIRCMVEKNIYHAEMFMYPANIYMSSRELM